MTLLKNTFSPTGYQPSLNERVPLNHITSTYCCHPQWAADLTNLTNQKMHLTINIDTHLNISKANCVENEQTTCTSEWECACTKESISQRTSASRKSHVALEESCWQHVWLHICRTSTNVFLSIFLKVYAFIFWFYTEQPTGRVRFISQSSLYPKVHVPETNRKDFCVTQLKFLQLVTCLYY